MAQIYFLSVLFNVIAGLILVYGKSLKKNESSESLYDDDPFAEDREDEAFDAENSMDNNSETVKGIKKEKEGILTDINSKTFRLITGILCVFVGIMKLLNQFRNDVAIIGDLLPALAGIAGGASLLIEYYVVISGNEFAVPDLVKTVFVDSKKYIGIGCLAAGLLHFIFPQVVLL